MKSHCCELPLTWMKCQHFRLDHVVALRRQYHLPLPVCNVISKVTAPRVHFYFCRQCRKNYKQQVRRPDALVTLERTLLWECAQVLSKGGCKAILVRDIEEKYGHLFYKQIVCKAKIPMAWQNAE